MYPEWPCSFCVLCSKFFHEKFPWPRAAELRDSVEASMKCLQCNSSQVEKRSAGMWCAECRDYVQVFHEPAAPKSGSTYRFAKPPEAAAPVDSQSTTADPAAVPDFPLTPPG